MNRLHIAAAALAVVGGVAAGLTGQALLLAAPAHADGYCTTSRYSGMSFTTCRYSDPWQPPVTITCFDATGNCSFREG